MAILARTITLDPAFLHEIKEDDRRLKVLLKDFRQLIFAPHLTESNRPPLAAQVMELRDRLAFHFTLEEAYGYFEDPIVVAPRLCDRVVALKAEHGELYAEIAGIADALEARESCRRVDLAAIQNDCREFLCRFDIHEAAENALIVQAFHEDIGVGD